MPPTPALLAAIEALYAAFKRPHPSRIDGCPCCWEDKDSRALTVTPLRDMTSNQLSRYSAKVFTTVGNLGDYKYFLPRILELTVIERGWPDTEIVFGKLALAEWQYWPKDEHRAVQAFVDAWFDAEVTQAAPPEEGFYYTSSVDQLLCGMAKAGMELAPYLQRLLIHPEALGELYHTNAEELLNRDRLSNGFWEDANPAVVAGVMAFLRSEAVLEVMRR